jgi:hypothetical protein
LFNNPYRVLGLGLITAGVIFTPIAYFVLNTPYLTVTGIAMLILGFTAFALATARPYISPEASRLLLETGMENTSALLEELSLRQKAIYLPSGLRGGKAQAIIPITDKSLPKVLKDLPGRLIVRYGNGPDELAIAVATPGSINLAMLRNPPGQSAGELESAVSYLLVGVLDLASGVNFSLDGDRARVVINRPRLHWENIAFYQVLGSPLASIAAAVTAEGLGKPVRITGEKYEKGTAVVELELLP